MVIITRLHGNCKVSLLVNNRTVNKTKQRTAMPGENSACTILAVLSAAETFILQLFEQCPPPIPPANTYPLQDLFGQSFIMIICYNVCAVL
jgi:hypothetical protein